MEAAKIQIKRNKEILSTIDWILNWESLSVANLQNSQNARYCHDNSSNSKTSKDRCNGAFPISMLQFTIRHETNELIRVIVFDSDLSDLRKAAQMLNSESLLPPRLEHFSHFLWTLTDSSGEPIDLGDLTAHVKPRGVICSLRLLELVRPQDDVPADPLSCSHSWKHVHYIPAGPRNRANDFNDRAR
jgi:hypothetical protein